MGSAASEAILEVPSEAAAADGELVQGAEDAAHDHRVGGAAAVRAINSEARPTTADVPAEVAVKPEQQQQQHHQKQAQVDQQLRQAAGPDAAAVPAEPPVQQQQHHQQQHDPQHNNSSGVPAAATSVTEPIADVPPLAAAAAAADTGPSAAAKADAAAPAAAAAGGGGPEAPLPMVPDKEEGDSTKLKPTKLKNYASKDSGAVMMEHSPGTKGADNLLVDSKDKYTISPCEEKQWVVIGLSEDILVRTIKLGSYEKYSRIVKEFQVLASQSFPVDNWMDLGVFTAADAHGEQTFELPSPAFARYLKFKLLSHYGDDYYCTLSHVRVHGSTMLESFHEDWQASTNELEEIQSKLHGKVDTDAAAAAAADALSTDGAAAGVAAAAAAAAPAPALSTAAESATVAVPAASPLAEAPDVAPAVSESTAASDAVAAPAAAPHTAAQEAQTAAAEAAAHPQLKESEAAAAAAGGDGGTQEEAPAAPPAAVSAELQQQQPQPAAAVNGAAVPHPRGGDAAAAAAAPLACAADGQGPTGAAAAGAPAAADAAAAAAGCGDGSAAGTASAAESAAEQPVTAPVVPAAADAAAAEAAAEATAAAAAGWVASGAEPPADVSPSEQGSCAAAQGACTQPMGTLVGESVPAAAAGAPAAAAPPRPEPAPLPPAPQPHQQQQQQQQAAAPAVTEALAAAAATAAGGAGGGGGDAGREGATAAAAGGDEAGKQRHGVGLAVPCQDLLSFTAFREKMLAKTPAKEQAVAIGGQYENIFRTMLNKIKGLEISQSLFGLYVDSLHQCYGGVIDELRVQADTEDKVRLLHSEVERLQQQLGRLLDAPPVQAAQPLPAIPMHESAGFPELPQPLRRDDIVLPPITPQGGAVLDDRVFLSAIAWFSSLLSLLLVAATLCGSLCARAPPQQQQQHARQHSGRASRSRRGHRRSRHASNDSRPSHVRSVSPQWRRSNSGSLLAAELAAIDGRPRSHDDIPTAAAVRRPSGLRRGSVHSLLRGSGAGGGGSGGSGDGASWHKSRRSTESMRSSTSKGA